MIQHSKHTTTPGAEVSPIAVPKALSGIHYPADKKQLLATAEAEGAKREVREMRECLPEKQYESPADVSKEVGKHEHDAERGAKERPKR